MMRSGKRRTPTEPCWDFWRRPTRPPPMARAGTGRPWNVPLMRSVPGCRNADGNDRVFERALVVVLLTGPAGLKARRFEAESLAAGGAQRNQHSERQHLPCRRVAHVQDGQVEIVAERPQHIEAAARPKEARFEKRR